MAASVADGILTLDDGRRIDVAEARVVRPVPGNPNAVEIDYQVYDLGATYASFGWSAAMVAAGGTGASKQSFAMTFNLNTAAQAVFVNNAAAGSGAYVVPVGFELQLTAATFPAFFHVSVIGGNSWGQRNIGVFCEGSGAALTTASPIVCAMGGAYHVPNITSTSTAPSTPADGWAPASPHICRAGSRVGFVDLLNNNLSPNNGLYGVATLSGVLVSV